MGPLNQPSSLDKDGFMTLYQWLLGRARFLTKGTRINPYDLVHTLYIRLSKPNAPPLPQNEIHRRQYLAAALQNIFYSGLSRFYRDPLGMLNATGVDTEGMSSVSTDVSLRVQYRSEVAASCEYGCLRRQSHLAGSAFLLRHLLGYTAEEVSLLLRWPRPRVTRQCDWGRLEAQAYIERPQILGFLKRIAPTTPRFPRFLPEGAEQMYAELRRRIFFRPEGSCLSDRTLENHYRCPTADPFTRQEVAHLTSCESCHDAAVQHAGLHSAMNNVESYSLGSR